MKHFKCFVVAPVARMLRFWKTPMLTTGALSHDFTKRKTQPDSEYHLLLRMGHVSFTPMAHFIVDIMRT